MSYKCKSFIRGEKEKVANKWGKKKRRLNYSQYINAYKLGAN
jgi:hypothetical protein